MSVVFLYREWLPWQGSAEEHCQPRAPRWRIWQEPGFYYFRQRAREEGVKCYGATVLLGFDVSTRFKNSLGSQWRKDACYCAAGSFERVSLRNSNRTKSPASPGPRIWPPGALPCEASASTHPGTPLFGARRRPDPPQRASPLRSAALETATRPGAPGASFWETPQASHAKMKRGKPL